MINAILEGYPKSKKELLVSESNKINCSRCKKKSFLMLNILFSFYRKKLEWRLMKIVRWFPQVHELESSIQACVDPICENNYTSQQSEQQCILYLLHFL